MWTIIAVGALSAIIGAGFMNVLKYATASMVHTRSTSSIALLAILRSAVAGLLVLLTRVADGTESIAMTMLGIGLISGIAIAIKREGF